MKNTEDAYHAVGHVGTIDRLLRIVVGITALSVLLHLSIVNNLALSYEMLLATLVSLTGIIAWDPLYAIVQSMFHDKSKPNSLVKSPTPNTI